MVLPSAWRLSSLWRRSAASLAGQALAGAAEAALRKRPRPSCQCCCARAADAARALTQARRSVAVHYAAAVGLGLGQGRGEGRGRRHGGDGLLRQATEWRRSGERQYRRGDHGSKLHAPLLPKTRPIAPARPSGVAARSASYLTADNTIGPVRSGTVLNAQKGSPRRRSPPCCTASPTPVR